MNEEEYNKLIKRYKKRYIKTIGYNDKQESVVTYIKVAPSYDELWEAVDQIDRVYFDSDTQDKYHLGILSSLRAKLWESYEDYALDGNLRSAENILRHKGDKEDE